MIKKTIIVTGVIVFLLSGCAGPKPRNQEAFQLMTEKQMIDKVVKARQENYEENRKTYEEMVKQRVLERASIEASTVTIDAETNGLIRQLIGDLKLNLRLRESNGVGATIHTYKLRISCIHDYHLKTIHEERVGTFFLDERIILPPFQTKAVSIEANGWAKKNLNRMNRLLSSDRYSMELELRGQDDNGHELRIQTTSGAI